ncbi:metal ABC transporter ATP-binding protein [Haloechinothrix halophila]|uniref:metal ABC transporter ATP-binding protein n=1 Tax=Haloechinothrix halophila TaxID=1069073 RepID=UPI0003F76459|nr:metal ABC transporter ATP-binding protein [Haloechinothrix halophila]
MTEPVIRIRDASLSFGPRTLWSGMNLDVERGEFLAVLGPNGSGKSTLLSVLLGQQRLSSGTVHVAARGQEIRAVPGGPAPRGVGYIPQQGVVEFPHALRGTDLVGLGLDGHRWGIGLRGAAERRRRVAEAIDAVSAGAFANRPLSLLSGGEQQRLRVAQALVGEPDVLLCDEPLLSLDIANQRAVSELIERRRREAGTAVLFVTHEINPVLSYVDKVLYLVDGRFSIGSPDEVMTSATLSALYRTTVDVVRIGGQIHVTGPHSAVCEDDPHHSHPQA